MSGRWIILIEKFWVLAKDFLNERSENITEHYRQKSWPNRGLHGVKTSKICQVPFSSVIFTILEALYSLPEFCLKVTPNHNGIVSPVKNKLKLTNHKNISKTYKNDVRIITAFFLHLGVILIMIRKEQPII